MVYNTNIKNIRDEEIDREIINLLNNYFKNNSICHFMDLTFEDIELVCLERNTYLISYRGWLDDDNLDSLPDNHYINSFIQITINSLIKCLISKNNEILDIITDTKQLEGGLLNE